MIADYQEFISRKRIVDAPTGLPIIPELNSGMFGFQSDIVKWALSRGRAAIFAGCGMGKTIMQLDWARCVPGNVLILAPLAVAQQTEREGVKFGIPCKYVRKPTDGVRIQVTNYEMLDHFDAADFNGIVLDESSILKAYDGKTRTRIIDAFSQTPFRLACTATPAPNDYMELGNHSEFLGIMNRSEMLATFFINDASDTGKWRLKKHATEDFWRWLSSWAVMIRMPSDLGYPDDGFSLPPISYLRHIAEVDHAQARVGDLFRMPAVTLMERRQERRLTIGERVNLAAEIANSTDDQWMIWCDLNDESDALGKKINGAREVRGSNDAEYKMDSMMGFIDGKYRALVSKPSICGFGMNFQNCHKIVFVGLSDSYEQFYQAVRRCWRFGQTSPVDVHIIIAETEGAVLSNIARKDRESQGMIDGMLTHMASYVRANVVGLSRDTAEYKNETEMGIPQWLK